MTREHRNIAPTEKLSLRFDLFIDPDAVPATKIDPSTPARTITVRTRRGRPIDACARVSRAL
ncbi:hypothetical protein [Bradyrhizobium brasilense]|uniref:Uncharacterized protein n=1 Tax=Bradyrhizobium brasilense TaxID=1419277 RepID=A0ABY8JQG9_9BRAD|nr:hypothetical protein [Bradyrhizobium brasilense]WFU66716.1 hypothetical protein QA636_14900 [Bradyrhizobium brasilense]